MSTIFTLAECNVEILTTSDCQLATCFLILTLSLGNVCLPIPHLFYGLFRCSFRRPGLQNYLKR